MHSMRLLGTGLLASAAAACTAVQPECPREWIEVRAGVYDDESRRPVDDGFGWSIGGGYDLNADLVRVSWEVALAWSPHDVGVTPNDPEEDDVDLYAMRWSTGLRATLRFDGVPLGAYVHGGGAWRDERSNDSAFPGDDQWGGYVGGGLEWWYEPNASLGPALLHFEGEEDVDETWAGLVARFYI